MRRKDREITEREALAAILGRFDVCRLAMMDEPCPYLVPLNYGYDFSKDGLTLYFHSAREGRKIDLLRKNPNVGFEIDGGHALIKGPLTCNYSFCFESIIGTGKVSFLEDPAEKTRALNLILKNVAGTEESVFPEKSLAATLVFQLKADQFTAKRCAAK